jgi:arginase
MTDVSHHKRIALLGAPVEVGASQRGTLMGPAAMRTAGLGPLLEELGFEVEDHGDLMPPSVPLSTDAPPENAKHYRVIQNWIQALSARAYTLAKSGALPIFVGGDHSLSMGSVNGVARHWHEQGRELFVLWLDAHADYNTPHTTITGNMHGMSAAFLCGEPVWMDYSALSRAHRSRPIISTCSASALSISSRKSWSTRARSPSQTCGRLTSSVSAS